MIHVIAILKPLYLHIHATECCYVTVFSPPSKLIVYNYCLHNTRNEAHPNTLDSFQ